MKNLGRLRDFVRDMARLVERHGADEPRTLDEGEKLLRGLVAQDDWLPEEFISGYHNSMLPNLWDRARAVPGN